jgi:hypothetical protein
MASYGKDFETGGPYEVKNTGYIATDEEKNNYDVGPRHPSVVGSVRAVTDQTHRKLKSRHIQLIGIGGTIGTALYVQIGRGLMNGGPGSLFLAFSLWYAKSPFAIHGGELTLTFQRCTVILAVTLSETLHFSIPNATTPFHCDNAHARYQTSQSTVLRCSR